MEPQGNEILVLISGILAAVNTAMIIYAAWKKLKPEVKKMDAEVDSEIVEAAELNLKGAQVSTTMLLERIADLKMELETERRLRKEELAAERAAREADLEAERAARKKEGEYLRRRFKEAEREARDYRQWAAKLAKQVVESGKVPAPFIPSPDDSETGISAIRGNNDK